jgi:hypothetical protein
MRAAPIGRAAAAAALGALAVAAVATQALAGPSRASWRPYLRAPAVVDVVGPRSDGRLVVADGTHLSTLRAGGSLRPFATGPDGYVASAGEPYIALSRRARVEGRGCAFPRDNVYALDTGEKPGIVRISRRGHASRFAKLPGGTFPTGIAFDRVGLFRHRFGHRLLVVGQTGGITKVYAIDCTGRVSALPTDAPALEGGMAVAPRGFGAFAGDLIAADEATGEVFAVGPHGVAHLLARPGLPTGGDVGVESVGFVPRRLDRGHAYVADRLTPGNPHPGTGSILRLGLAKLFGRGVRAGDLLVATEGGARTVRIRCAASCTTREVAVGPEVAHVEGHIPFLPGPRRAHVASQ